MDLQKLKQRHESVKRILKATKKNNGEVYLTDFRSKTWEKHPENNKQVQVTFVPETKYDYLLEQIGTVTGFETIYETTGDYYFVYKIHLTELDLDIELLGNQFEIIGE